jgi:hypothetical protein
MNLRQSLTTLAALFIASGCGSQASNRPATAVNSGQSTSASQAPVRIGFSDSPNLTQKPTAPSGDIVWVRYEDPLEQAFTMEVPKGWTVKAGMFRLGFQDYRLMVDITSPDAKINFRLGDVSVPQYFLPNQFHREGEVDDLGASGQARFERYRTGQDFAAAYGKARFARLCWKSGQRQTTLPPLTKTDAPEGMRATEGEATFTCDDSLGERTAYTYAQTSINGENWQVTNLASYVAPEAEVAFVRSVIIHVRKTYHINPSWLQYQREMGERGMAYQQWRQDQRRKALGQQIAEFQENMQQMRNQVTAFEHGQVQRQKQFQAWDNIVSGISPATDPYGDTVNVINGSKNYYFQDPGTHEVRNSNTSPGPGWQQVTINH